MKKDALDFLCCPECKGSLSLHIRKQNDQELKAGKLICNSCSLEYPIVSDRPILMSNNTIHNWLSPIDEAFDPSIVTRPEGSLSILRLNRLGTKEAIKVAASNEGKHACGLIDVRSDLKKLRGKIKYIKSGNWFKARGREAGFRAVLSNPGESVRAFLNLIQSMKSSSLVDIASGGGSGIVSIANLLDDDVRVFSCERDLQCLWIIQKKFKRIGKANISEAIGADVRQMPYKVSIKENSLQRVPEPFYNTKNYILHTGVRVMNGCSSLLAFDMQ